MCRISTESIVTSTWRKIGTRSHHLYSASALVWPRVLRMEEERVREKEMEG
jgi:hypothetical protein